MRWAIAVLVCATGCDLVFAPGKGPGAGAADAPGDDVVDDAGGGDDAAGDRDGPIADAGHIVDAAGLACPPQYSSWTPPSYGLHTGGATWADALEICLADQVTVPPGGAFVHLAVLDDEVERDAVTALAGDRTVWVGASDQVNENDFWTVTTQANGYPPNAAGAPWALEQPDGSGNCVRLLGTADGFPGALDDQDCAALHDFMCECDAFPDDPSKY